MSYFFRREMLRIMANLWKAAVQGASKSDTQLAAPSKKSLRACPILWRCKSMSTTMMSPHSKLSQLLQMFVGLSPNANHIIFYLTFVDAPLDQKVAVLTPILSPRISHSLQRIEIYKRFKMMNPYPIGNAVFLTPPNDFH